MRSAGLEFEEVNYAKRPLTADEVRAIVAAAGSTAAVLNLRHALVKERSWASSPPSVEALVEAACVEPNVLRRPVLVVAGRAIIGFDRAAYEALAKG